MTTRFAAPWGTSVKVVTGLVLLIVGTAASLVMRGDSGIDPARAPIGAGLAALVLGCAMFTIRGYALDGRTLYIHRLFWDTELDLRSLRAAAGDPMAMRGSFRLFGNGGFFAVTGWFQNRHLGRYRAFVMDPGRAVVLTLGDRVVVVSPEDPDRFVAVVRETFGLHVDDAL